MELVGNGAGDGIRTRDINLGKVALYQLSYSRDADSFQYGARRLDLSIPVSGADFRQTSANTNYSFCFTFSGKCLRPFVFALCLTPKVMPLLRL